MDIGSEVTYPFDRTGQAETNKVGPERHVLTSTNWTDFNIVVPVAAPFFAESMIDSVYHYPSGQKLVHGVDWVEGWYFQSASGEIGARLYGCIVFMDTALSGEIELREYQTLGGDWVLDGAKLEQILASKLANPIRTYWEQVTELPCVFPPLDHEHDVEDWTTFQDLLNSLGSIEAAILAGNDGGLDAHKADRNNPHGTDKNHVGLGLVPNWAPATAPDIIPGQLKSAAFMNPPMTEAMIQQIALTALTLHANDFTNSHRVTAAQVDAFTKDEVIQLMNDLLSGGVGEINAARLDGYTRLQIIDQVLEQVDLKLVTNNAQVIQTVADMLSGFQAEDTAKFGGMTVEEWEQKIRDLAVSGGNYHFFEKVVTIPAGGDLEWPQFDGPTYTQIGTLEYQWENNYKQEDAVLYLCGGNAKTNDDPSVIQVTFSGTNRNKIRANVIAGKPSDTTYYLLPNPDVVDGYTIWAYSPTERRAISATSQFDEMVKIAQETTVIDEDEIEFDVADLIEITVQNGIHPDQLSSLQYTFNAPTIADGRNISQVDAERLGGQLPAYYAAQSGVNNNTTSIFNLNNAVLSLTDRVGDLEQGSRTVVDEYRDMNAETSIQFDLQTILGAQHAQFNKKAALVQARVRDDENGSDTEGAYINSEAMVKVALVDERYVRVFNRTTEDVSVHVRIDVSMNP